MWAVLLLLASGILIGISIGISIGRARTGR